MSIAWGGLITSSCYLLLVGIAVFRYRKKSLPAAGAELPPVTLLKPVHGIEPQLRDSLESFFRLDYPQFEIIFGALPASSGQARHLRRAAVAKRKMLVAGADDSRRQFSVPGYQRQRRRSFP
jgi:ceramide glucosyltransferase